MARAHRRHRQDRPAGRRRARGSARRQAVQRSRLEDQPAAPEAAAELPCVGGGDQFLCRQDRARRSGSRARQTDRQYCCRRAGADERPSDQPDRDEEAGRHRRRRACGRVCKTISTISSRTAACRPRSTPRRSRSERISRRRPAPWCSATDVRTHPICARRRRRSGGGRSSSRRRRSTNSIRSI